MHLLILGNTGQVGGMLVQEAPHYLEHQYTRLTTAGRRDADVILDITSPESINNALNELQADLIVNAIAYTAVDKAESEPELAQQINAELPENLARWCADNNAQLIHYSTDFVFDGQANSAYSEQDDTGPLSVYGESKLAGEQALLNSAASSVILRTSWVYGETGNNFMKTMQRFGREREVMGIVADQKGTPTYSRHLAIMTCYLIRAIQQNAKHFQGKQHIYHASAKGETTWHGFAEAIFKAMADYEAVKVSEVNAIGTADYPTPARRPSNSVLNCEKLKQELNLDMPDWHEGLIEAMCRAYAGDTA